MKLTLTTISLAIIAITLRLLTALQGNNFDVESWWIVSEIQRAGASVYAETSRYNYGPVWMYLLSGLRAICVWLGYDTITALHLAISLLLSISDCCLAALVLSMGSRFGALVLLFNPISLLVSGYHAQFDSLAILIGLVGWRAFVDARSLPQIITSAIIFGASLATKHVFLLFLPWVPLLVRLHTFPQRLTFATIAGSIFLIGFTPWVTDPASVRGIIAHVINYRSTEGHSIVSWMAGVVPFLHDRSLFLALLVGFGVLSARYLRYHTTAPLLYLILLTALASGMARNYLAVPLVGVILTAPRALTYGYLILASALFVNASDSLGSRELAFTFSHTPLLSYEVAQVFLLAIAIGTLMAPGQTRAYQGRK